MSKKGIAIGSLVLVICFLILGAVFKSTADRHKGVAVSTGIVTNGTYSATSSGRMGANSEKYNKLNSVGNVFFVLSGVMGVVCIVSFVGYKKEK